ncbi:MAG: helix-turn-helix domain-containing protein [Dongiaceae bacterium]
MVTTLTMDNLREYLEFHGLSAAEFARRIGIKSRSTIFRYLRGRRPRADYKSKISIYINGLSNNIHIQDKYNRQQDASLHWQIALMILGARVKKGGKSGLYTLDGRPCGGKGLIQAANAELRCKGFPLLFYPGLRPLPEKSPPRWRPY